MRAGGSSPRREGRGGGTSGAIGRRGFLQALAAGGAATLLGCPAPWRPKYGTAEWSNPLHQRCIQLAPNALRQPTTLEHIVAIVREAEARHLRVRAVGGSYSFSDAAFADGLILKTAGLSRDIPIDPNRLRARARSAKLVCVEGGVVLKELCSRLDQRRLALANMGGFAGQSLAGVISTSTHGSGLNFGPFPSFVRSLVLVASGGQVLQIEPKDGPTDPAAFGDVVVLPQGTHPAKLVQDDQAFSAALVGFGCMGVLYAVTLEVVSAFWIHEERHATFWEDVRLPGGILDQILAGRLSSDSKDPRFRERAPDYYELLLAPYPLNGKHRCVVNRRWAVAPLEKPGAGCAEQAGLIESFGLLLGVTNPDMVPDAIEGDPKKAANLLDLAVNAEVHTCYENKSYGVFDRGKINDVRGFSVDISVDARASRDAVDHVLRVASEELAARIGAHTGPISVRFVQGSNAYLSPQYGRASCCIEIFAIMGALGTDALLRNHERELMNRFDGRPHWGLDLNAIESRKELEALYPALAAWHDEYAKNNASGVFDGEITDRLGISMAPMQAANRSHACIPISE